MVKERQQESSGKVKELRERLREARQLLRLSQKALGERWDYSETYIYYLESGKKPIGKKLESKVIELENEVNKKLYPEHKPDAHMLVDALSPDRRKQEGAPVVSWASAGLGGNYYDLAGFLDEIVETDCRDPNKYALIVEGNSMEPEVKAGERIVVAPNYEAQNGNLVVARLEKSGQVLFKLYHETAKQLVRLTSFNPAYVPMEYQRREFRFIHPVWSATKSFMKGRK